MPILTIKTGGERPVLFWDGEEIAPTSTVSMTAADLSRAVYQVMQLIAARRQTVKRVEREERGQMARVIEEPPI